ncbi:MAG: recombinase RecT, partial [Bacilli bacterium]
QGYFIGIDRALQVQEENRVRKNEKCTDPKYMNDLPYIWQNVNLKDLALDVVHYARMGLDMMQKNHISPIPYKNNKTNMYDITLMPGYVGIEYIARKYATEPPTAVTTELVYSTDTFKPIKKNRENKVESYEFEINNPFDRGEIIGGFGYIEYSDPAKNTLIIMTKADVEKRKPQYAAAEFWGGTIKKYVNGKLTSVETDGWYPEMFEKTIRREVFNEKHIQRDPQKIDDNYQYMKMRESRMAEMAAQNEIDANANTIIINADTGEVEQHKLTPPQNEKPQTEAAPADVDEDDLP